MSARASDIDDTLDSIAIAPPPDDFPPDGAA
jgi:hypothetical protein